MKIKLFFFTTLFALGLLYSEAQNHTDAVIIGHVVSRGEHIPFVNIYLEGTNFGTTTDVTGHYMMTDAPLGEYILIARMVGYKIMN